MLNGSMPRARDRWRGCATGSRSGRARNTVLRATDFWKAGEDRGAQARPSAAAGQHARHHLADRQRCGEAGALDAVERNQSRLAVLVGAVDLAAGRIVIASDKPVAGAHEMTTFEFVIEVAEAAAAVGKSA